MKRTLCLLLCLLLLWGCGEAASVTETTEPAKETAPAVGKAFSAVECFGEIPAEFQSEENLILLRGAIFLETGFLSADGQGVQQFYGYDFQPQQMPELPREDDYTTMGFHNGDRISYNDRIFEPTAADRLPQPDEAAGERLLPLGIFDREGGYILVRIHCIGNSGQDDAALGYEAGSCELILTAYDTGGAPLWQTVGETYQE